MNQIQLLGRIVQDLELKETTSGKTYCRFRMAVNRRFKRDESDFFTVVAWGSLANTLVKYAAKGYQIAVNGSIHINDYTNSNGEKRREAEVVAEDIDIIFMPKENNSAPRIEKITPPDLNDDDNMSFDDLPFDI